LAAPRLIKQSLLNLLAVLVRRSIVVPNGLLQDNVGVRSGLPGDVPTNFFWEHGRGARQRDTDPDPDTNLKLGEDSMIGIPKGPKEDGDQTHVYVLSKRGGKRRPGGKLGGEESIKTLPGGSDHIITKGVVRNLTRGKLFDQASGRNVKSRQGIFENTPNRKANVRDLVSFPRGPEAR